MLSVVLFWLQGQTEFAAVVELVGTITCHISVYCILYVNFAAIKWTELLPRLFKVSYGIYAFSSSLINYYSNSTLDVEILWKKF